MRRFLVCAMALLLLVALASPALAAGPAGDQGQAQNGYGTVDHPASDTADAIRTQARDQSCEDCDSTCDGDQLKTRTMSQEQASDGDGSQAQLRVQAQLSGETTATPLQVRTAYAARYSTGLAEEIEALMLRLMTRLAWPAS